DQPLNLLYDASSYLKERYLLPVIRGEKYGGFALTEPGAGSDAGGIATTAVREGDTYVLNGTKVFISRMLTADFVIVVALTDPEKRARGGVSVFLVDRDTPGLRVGATTSASRPRCASSTRARQPVAWSTWPCSSTADSG